MPETKVVQLGQYLIASAEWKDNEGNAIYPVNDELPTWVCDKTQVVSCVASPANPGMADCRAIKLGDAVLTATANFDTGDGVIKSGSLTLPISVVEDYTPQGEIVLRYGTIAPVDRQTPK